MLSYSGFDGITMNIALYVTFNALNRNLKMQLESTRLK